MGGGTSRSGSSDGVTVPFARAYAQSEQFKKVFNEGMALVEAAAAYLDGEGRREARRLNSSAALVYATESMLLTTRLMQLASWLLIRRAVNEGELTLDEAEEEHHKVKLRPVAGSVRSPAFEELPQRLKELIDHSLRLHRRIVRLDALINARPRGDGAPPHNPLTPQLEWLRQAFEAESERRPE